MGAAEELAERLGESVESEDDILAPAIEQLIQALGDDAFHYARAERRRMSLEAAVATALASLD